VTHTASIYPRAGLESNYCRNPVPKEGATTIWCFIEGGTPRHFWEYCNPISDQEEVEPEDPVPTQKGKEVQVVGSVYRSLVGETQEGCYKDDRSRDLPNLLKGAKGEPKKCFELAIEKGF